ncbi:MAG: hypothetical protein IKN91_06355 [Paludibacteraceae bacterium]|nr:hypothetical protein [Paludibacteraceae bacterium]
MKSPKHLGHKPIVSVNDYDKVDGMYRNNTDAHALSIGWAQYDADEISMKVWRKRKHWSSQSEELPLHRNLDLTILLLHVLFDETPNPDSFLVKAKTLFSEDQEGGIEEIKKYYQKNKSFLEPRLKELRELLNKMK